MIICSKGYKFGAVILIGFINKMFVILINAYNEFMSVSSIISISINFPSYE